MNKECQDLGVEISNSLGWNGHLIVETFRAALEDANYHTFNTAVGAVWELQLKAEEDSE